MAEFRLCSIPNCGKPCRSAGLCGGHYERQRRYGDPLGGGTFRQKNGPVCLVSGCDQKPVARNLCSTHHSRWKRHGDPLGGTDYRGECQRYLLEVVLAYEGDECFPWPYGKNDKGYGTVKIGGRNRIVSRVVCEAIHGPPPAPGLHAAHECGKGHEACCAKRHLSWKTPSENWADRYVHQTDNSGERNGRWKGRDA